MAATPDTEIGEEGRLVRVKAAATIILDEYLVCESSLDAAHFVQDLSCAQYHAVLIKRLLTTAMDKSVGDQDKAATLVSSLCVRGVVEESDCEAGVELLLKSIRDLAIDVPKAEEYAARFLSHFLEDKIVPEAILESLTQLCGVEKGSSIKAQVTQLLDLPLPLTVMKVKVRSLLDEYFVSASAAATIQDLSELKSKRVGQEVVKRTLVLALDKKNRHKEMASLLLSAMTRLYGSEQFFEGFIRVLKSVDDLALDTPDVVAMMSKFIARAIVDDVLPPNFFSFVPERLLVGNSRVAAIRDSLDNLIQNQSSTRLMNIWGAGAKASVEELKESVKLLVDEYFVEGDIDEALDCVRDLDAPHFGHEVVKKIVYEAVERGDKDKSLRRAVELLKALQKTSILDAHQLTVGMQRCVEGLCELTMDVPGAAEGLRTIADLLAFEHLVSPALEQAVVLKAAERAARGGNGELTDERLHSAATFIVEEYLVCQSARDAAQAVYELGGKHEHVAKLVSNMLLLALDKPQGSQGLVGELLSSLVVRDAIEASGVEAGVEMVLKQLADLVIDIPKVQEYMAPLIAQLVEDGHVQETLVDSLPLLAAGEMGSAIKGKVQALINLPLPITTMKRKVVAILEDYFSSGDVHSAVAELGELANLEGKRPGQEAVKRTLVMALDKKNSGKERASVLLSAITRVYGSEQFFEGFIRVLKSIDDLALDTPNVADVLSQFIARAIIDDVLPPAFIDLVPKKLVDRSPAVRHVLQAVEVRLTRDKGGSTRIVNVWGAAAKSSVEELKQTVQTLVEEYFVSGDVEEAVRSVVEVDADEFGHEVVKRIMYQALQLAADPNDPNALQRACCLLKELVARGALSHSQLAKGLVRGVLGLEDLGLDVPGAAASFRALLNHMLQEKQITAELKEKLENPALAA